MVNSCSALKCKTRWKPDTTIQFHKFPLGDKILLEKWLHQVGRKDWMPTKSSVLCSKHFSANSYRSSPDLKGRKLLGWAVPTLFDFTPQKTTRQKRKASEKKLIKKCGCAKRPKYDQITKPYPYKFKIQQTVVEIKLGPGFPSYLQKSQEREATSPERRMLEEEKSCSCKQTTGPHPYQCKIQQTVVEMLDENEKLRKDVKTLQQKLRRRNRTVKSIRKRIELLDG